MLRKITMLRKIMTMSMAFCVLISLCSGISAMDDTDQSVYTPRTSKTGFLKTAMVGLGLMLSPTPADAVTEFGGCYLMNGTKDSYKNPTFELFKISQIRTSTCDWQIPPNLGSSNGPIVNTNMSLTLPETSRKELNFISEITFCSGIFTVNYDTIIDNGFDMQGKNSFYLNFKKSSYQTKNNFRMIVSKTDQFRDRDNCAFDQIFAQFMNTGACPTSTPPQ